MAIASLELDQLLAQHIESAVRDRLMPRNRDIRYATVVAEYLPREDQRILALHLEYELTNQHEINRLGAVPLELIGQRARRYMQAEKPAVADPRLDRRMMLKRAQRASQAKARKLTCRT